MFGLHEEDEKMAEKRKMAGDSLDLYIYEEFRGRVRNFI